MLSFPLPAVFEGGRFAAELAAAGLPVGALDVVVRGDVVEVASLTESDRATVEAALGSHAQTVTASRDLAAVYATNEQTINGRLDLAIDAMQAHVNRGTFTAAQRDAALLLVLRSCIGLARLVRRRLDSA